MSSEVAANGRKVLWIFFNWRMRGGMFQSGTTKLDKNTGWRLQ
jgi:hypothetical protein